MTQAYVWTTQATALTAQSTLDTDAGYPKAGVDIGGGIHAPPSQSITAHYQAVWQHPTLLEWAIMIDGTVSANAVSLSAAIGTALPVPTTLDATWFPPSP